MQVRAETGQGLLAPTANMFQVKVSEAEPLDRDVPADRGQPRRDGIRARLARRAVERDAEKRQSEVLGLAHDRRDVDVLVCDASLAASNVVSRIISGSDSSARSCSARNESLPPLQNSTAADATSGDGARSHAGREIFFARSRTFAWSKAQWRQPLPQHLPRDSWASDVKTE